MPTGIYIRTDENKKNLFKKGNIPWSKGLTKENNISLKKLSEKMKGREISKETKVKIGESMNGKRNSINTEFKKGNKINLGRKREPHSEEWKKNMSENMINKYKNKERIPSSLGKRGSNTPNWRGGNKEINCYECGAKVLINNYKLKLNKHTFCNKLCYSKYQQENPEELPNWKGGVSFEPYDLKWNNLFRNQIRKRDNQVCMLCGIHREKLTRALSVHHINYDKLLTIPENCISLCDSCHRLTMNNREYWIKFLQSILHERYNYNYTELNEPIIEINQEIK